MRKSSLTEEVIKSLKPKTNQYEIFDHKVSGLSLRVSPKGTKSFNLLFRSQRKRYRERLGKYPLLSLKEARSKAYLRNCQNSSSLKSVEEKFLQTENQNLGNKFCDISKEFIEKHIKRKCKTWKETERILNRQINPKIGLYIIHRITKKEVYSVLDNILENNGTRSAFHAFSTLRRLFNWSVQRGFLENSPCLGMNSPVRIAARDRVLSQDELKSILIASDKMEKTFAIFIRVLLLTGQRRSEVSRISWDDINVNQSMWTQKAEGNKSKRVHIVPLSQMCLDLILQLKNHETNLVFATRRNLTRPISGFSASKRKLDKISGVYGWTFHDLRRTAATEMGRLNIEMHIIEMILNHQTAHLKGISGIYNRYDYYKEKAVALDKWAEYVKNLLAET